MSGRKRVAVVGGGIAGLAAALRLRESFDVTVVDRADRLGGKLRTGRIGGRVVETGAETFLARDADDPAGGLSAAVALAQRLGLGDDLRHPATTAAGILVDGRLTPVPDGTLMGVPADVSTIDERAVAADTDRGGPLLGPGADVTVGALVRDRFGAAGADIVARLVDPLLGGVYAGRADDLSLAVTMPALAAAATREHTLQSAVRVALARRSPRPGPMFATVEGGLSRLVDAIVAVMPDVRVALGQPIRALHPDRDGYRLVRGSTRDPEHLHADAVLLAVPSHPAARLLESIAPDAAVDVGALDYASIGLVTLLLPAGALDTTELAERSGALIASSPAHIVKAITVFSTKWAPQRDGAVLLRASVGRYGDAEALRLDDDSLFGAVCDDLDKIAGIALPTPLASTVTRWGGALPQYAPGHLDRVRRARDALPVTVALAGAAYDGIGIPACIRSAERAADRLIGALS
jgi:oxygen-dependent protoporphyrinogen oxidase